MEQDSNHTKEAPSPVDTAQEATSTDSHLPTFSLRPLEHPRGRPGLGGAGGLGIFSQAKGSPCYVAQGWAAWTRPAGSRLPRPRPSAAPPPPRVSTACKAARSRTRCSHPPSGRRTAEKVGR